MRNVYFDPFGQYTAGYDSGAQREAQQQGQVREARMQDFNYNYEKPLELKALQRADTLGAFALPYQQKAVQYADRQGLNNTYNSDQAINKQFGVDFGITQPYEDTSYRHFGITPHVQQFTTQPQINPNEQHARIELGNAVGALPEPQDNWTLDQISGYKDHVAQIAAGIASKYGMQTQTLMSPAAPTQYGPPVPQVQYSMVGPDGQPVNVGNVINPRQNLLDQWARPDAMKDVLLRYGMSKDVYEAQQAQIRNQQQQDWMDIQRGYRNSTGTDPISGLWPHANP